MLGQRPPLPDILRRACAPQVLVLELPMLQSAAQDVDVAVGGVARELGVEVEQLEDDVGGWTRCCIR